MDFLIPFMWFYVCTFKFNRILKFQYNMKLWQISRKIMQKCWWKSCKNSVHLLIYIKSAAISLYEPQKCKNNFKNPILFPSKLPSNLLSLNLIECIRCDQSDRYSPSWKEAKGNYYWFIHGESNFKANYAPTRILLI